MTNRWAEQRARHIIMKTLTDHVAAVMHEWLPTIAKQTEEAGREAVQTVVWLVGLASGLVTLLAINSGIVTSISTGNRRALILALSVTITCGVLQRITYQLAERYERTSLLGLQGYLVGQMQDFDQPDELGERWDRNEIVLRLARDFHLDLTPLNEFNLPIDMYRNIYTNHLEGWQKYQVESLQRLGEVLGAYFGMSTDSASKVFRVDQSALDLNKVRKRALRIRRIYNVAFFLFVGNCVSFLIALLFLGYAIWR